MAYYKDLFTRHMESKGIRYTDIDEHSVRVVFNGENLKSIIVYVFFDQDGDPLVQFKCWDIANFRGREETGYRACNQANDRWRWAKFYLDRESDLNACIDAYIDASSCGEICLSLLGRLVDIIDSAYPTFA